MKTRGRRKKNGRPKTTTKDKAKALFLCVVSADEAGEENDWHVTFQVLLPAPTVDDVPDLLAAHLKKLRRDGTVLTKDRSLTIYLDHIFELTGPVTAPLMINYVATRSAEGHGQIGNFGPEDSEGTLLNYGWSPDDVPEGDEPEEVKPFLVFKSADGKTAADRHAAVPANNDRAKVRSKLSQCGWRDASTKRGMKLKVERRSISIEVSQSESTMKNAFDLVITHKPKSKTFPVLKYLVGYEDRLDRVLESIADMGREIEDSNIRDCLREVHRASSEIYVYGKEGPLGLRAMGERF